MKELHQARGGTATQERRGDKERLGILEQLFLELGPLARAVANRSQGVQAGAEQCGLQTRTNISSAIEIATVDADGTRTGRTLTLSKSAIIYLNLPHLKSSQLLTFL